MNQDKAKYIKIAVLCAVVMFVFAYFMYTSISRSGKVAVEVSVLPQDAEIMVGEIVTRDNSTLYLEPGIYSVSAARNGFEPYNETFTITTRNNVIDFALSPNSEEAFDYIEENQQLYLDFEDRSGNRAIAAGEFFSEQNPITRELPYNSFFFTIGYRIDPASTDENSIIIEIDAGEGYKDAALQHLRNIGYNPTEYNINFRDHRNPFDE